VTRIVSLAEIGDPLEVEALVRAVHGEGDRAPGWFSRKLHRECVDPHLSRLAMSTDGQWLGYVLVGTPPSTPSLARTCGAGVIAPMRGRGLGRALFEAVDLAVAAAGYAHLRVPAALEQVGFFERIGFRRTHEHATLLAFASGQRHAITFGDPLPWDITAAASLREHAGWLCEAWERTEPSLRATVEIDGVVLHVTREGRAVVTHRVCAPSSLGGARVAQAIEALRERLVAPTPTLLTFIAPVSSVTASLIDAGWVVVQRSVLMEKPVEKGP
jgi:GNAT superfamily N-acetyltransferase